MTDATSALAPEETILQPYHRDTYPSALSWAGIPQHAWFLDSIREGVVLEQHPLEKASNFFIGSNPQEVDIVYGNPAVSRRHAAIQFSHEGGCAGCLLGEPFIVDLYSTHGSWKGETRLVPGHYTPLEDGDRLVFGNQRSHRAFVLRKGSSSGYPEAVTLEAAHAAASLRNDRVILAAKEHSSTRTVEEKENPSSENAVAPPTLRKPLFTTEGKVIINPLMQKALRNSVVSSGVVVPGNIKGASNESDDEESDSTISLLDRVMQYNDPKEGHLNYPALRKNAQLIALLNEEQLSYLSKAESAWGALRKARKTNEEEEEEKAIEESDDTGCNPVIAEKERNLTIYEERLFRMLDSENSGTGCDDQEQESIRPTLSASTKTAMDLRLFDEDDTFFDRSAEANLASSTMREGAHSAKRRRALLESELSQVNQLLAQSDSSDNRSGMETSPVDEDVLDQYMRHNNQVLRSALEQKQKELKDTLNQLGIQDAKAPKKENGRQPKRSTNVNAVNSMATASKTPLQSATGSGSHVNRAILVASSIMTKIAQAHSAKAEKNASRSLESDDEDD